MEKQQNNEPCGSRNFEETEKNSIKLTHYTLNMVYPIYWDGLNLVKNVINLLIESTPNATGNEKKYNLAYLMLLNRSIQHIESMRLLTERGLYGNSFVILRSLMSDLSMMQYLHFHPDLLDLFLEEKQEDYQKNKEFKKAFSEGAIERDLVKRGIAPFSISFKMLSKVSHTSSFGSQLYGSRGKKNGQYHFNYGPKYQPEKSLMLIDIVASSYYDLSNNILWHKYHAKENINAPEWDNVKADLRNLKEDVKIITGATKKAVNTLWPDLNKKI